MKHIILRSNTYHYRRRIPSALQSYIHLKYFYKTLSTNIKTARYLGLKYDVLFEELVSMHRLGLKPNINKLGLQTTKTEISAYESYLALERSEASQKVTSMHMFILCKFLPAEITTVTYSDIDKVTTSLKQLPKRNIQKYKKIPVKHFIKMEIPTKDKLSVRGVNAYLKTLKSFLSFCHKRNYLSTLYEVKLQKSTVCIRDERKSLSTDTILTLINSAKTTELQLAYQLLYLTGMRLSEAYKCKISEVDGVKCFDLRDRENQLKTQSSYRLIPVHKSIDEPERLLQALSQIKYDFIIKRCSKDLVDGTLYSLRHSFATHLASNDVEPHIISELMGHAHKTMPLSRYVKGFPIRVLKAAIDKL